MKVDLTIDQIRFLKSLCENNKSLAGECLYIFEEAIAIHDEVQEMAKKYNLSDNQCRFVEDALREDLEVDFKYSGRGMFGKTCPAVIVEMANLFITDANVETDNMADDIVVYAPR